MRKFNKILNIFIMAIVFWLILQVNSYARSITISTSKSTVSPGERFKVTVKVEGVSNVTIKVKNVQVLILICQS